MSMWSNFCMVGVPQRDSLENKEEKITNKTTQYFAHKGK